MYPLFVVIVIRNTTLEEQETVLSIMWELWTELPVYGRKAAQFVDLLGYFVLKTPDIPDKRVRYKILQIYMASMSWEGSVFDNVPAFPRRQTE